MTERTERDIDNLMRLMNFPRSMRDSTADIWRTSAGHYLRRELGDIGFNHFMGRPAGPLAGPGRDQMLAAWRSMGDEERRGAIAAAVIRGIDLAQEFGVPVADVPGFEGVIP